MNNVWITVGVVLVLLVEGNLLRVFMSEWRREARDERLRSRRIRGRADCAADEPTRRCTNPWRPVLAAAALAAVPCAAAAGTGSSEVSGAKKGETPRAFEVTNDDVSFARQPADPPPAAALPLKISTERPGFSDTTGIAAPLHLTLETGYTYTFRNRDDVESQTHNAPEILARVGLIEDRLEIRLGTAGYVWSRSNTGPDGDYESVEGFSDLYAGFKLKALDQQGLIPRIAIEAITTLSTGSQETSNRDLEPTLKLIGSWDLGSGFTLTSNGVLTYATTSGARFTQGAGSASLGYSVNDSLSLFLEYFVIGPRVKGADAAHSIDFGGAYLLNNRVQLDARLGFGLNEEADNVFVGAGISFLF